jgi:hypothetical protein
MFLILMQKVLHLERVVLYQSDGGWLYPWDILFYNNNNIKLLIYIIIDTTLCDKVWQWLEVDRLLSPSISVSSNNQTDFHDITEILLKVALNTITLTHIILKTEKTIASCLEKAMLHPPPWIYPSSITFNYQLKDQLSVYIYIYIYILIYREWM